MSKNNSIILGILFLALFFLNSCIKEGKGGAASIEGKIYVKLVKETTLDSLTTYPAQDERIYIVYGDNSTYNDDIRTSYDGNFKFDFLYKGDYTIYAYSECIQLIATCPNGTEPVIQNISISKANEAHKANDIIITKYIK